MDPDGSHTARPARVPKTSQKPQENGKEERCKSSSDSSSAVQVGWTPSHTGIAGNELADAAANLAAEGTPGPSDNFPWSYPHLRTQIRGQLLREWQVWHKPRDYFPFSPSTKLWAIFSLSRHAATRLFQMELAASYLLGRPGVRRKSRQLTTLYSDVPPVSVPGGPSPKPWTSSPPGMMPLQLKCSLSSSAAPSLPILRDSPPPRTVAPLPPS